MVFIGHTHQTQDAVDHGDFRNLGEIIKLCDEHLSVPRRNDALTVIVIELVGVDHHIDHGFILWA